MTPTQQHEINVAIAEACGWGFVPSDDDGNGNAFPESWVHETEGERDEVPNYCGSLDLMATAEATLGEMDKVHPLDGTAGLFPSVAYRFELVAITGQSSPHLATASQRAEAFCRVKRIGPWREAR